MLEEQDRQGLPALPLPLADAAGMIQSQSIVYSQLVPS